MLGEALFSMSVAQSLQQLEQLTVRGIEGLKHITGSGRGHGSNTNNREFILAPRNSRFLMPRLSTVDIADCSKLESLFPICCAEGLVQLQEIRIRKIAELIYVFGGCDHYDHSSLQFDNQILLPRLKYLRVEDLDNLSDMCPRNYPAMWSSPSKITVENCPKFNVVASF
ncbi:hypothetical protein VNO77_42889 [Canavalia gladiata]|uniref:Disease resistance protein At4g27190-like leucine-rich repeats domain-containing protein n=1 Tax=Canavalia gladiata TaxID=3824 RepID=A0AAN9JTT6_CANGL